jgi:hypothetical protein
MMRKMLLLVFLLFSVSGCSRNPPIIISFSVDREFITSTDNEIELSWNIDGADSVSISPDIGFVSGSKRKLFVSESKTFVLVAQNSLGETRATVKIVVKKPTSYKMRLVFQSERLENGVKDYVGMGEDYDFSYDNIAPNQVLGLVEEKIDQKPSYIRLIGLPRNGRFVILDFSTRELKTSLAIGSYINSERASFASFGHSGLDMSFDGRGCNVLSGSFSVKKISFAKDTNVYGSFRLDQFHADFIQYCDGNPAALRGNVYFDPIFD